MASITRGEAVMLMVYIMRYKYNKNLQDHSDKLMSGAGSLVD